MGYSHEIGVPFWSEVLVVRKVDGLDVLMELFYGFVVVHNGEHMFVFMTS
jgi:hypothetical protein